MDALAPQRRLGEPFVGRVTEHLLDLRADVEEAAVRARLGFVDDRRQPLDQLAKAALDSRQGALGLHPCGRLAGGEGDELLARGRVADGAGR